MYYNASIRCPIWFSFSSTCSTILIARIRIHIGLLATNKKSSEYGDIKEFCMYVVRIRNVSLLNTFYVNVIIYHFVRYFSVRFYLSRFFLYENFVLRHDSCLIRRVEIVLVYGPIGNLPYKNLSFLTFDLGEFLFVSTKTQTQEKLSFNAEY